MAARVRAVSIVDALADDLRARIFGGELAGGAALTEHDVASGYDVARPTAKAAIEKLVAEGLLRRGPHKTAQVPVIGAADAEDLYFSRIFVERGVLRELAGTGEVPPAARDALEEIVRAGEVSTIDIVQPDVRFHEALVDAIGSTRISRLYRGLMGEMRLCMAQVQAKGLLKASTIATEHRRILDAIGSADPDEAERAIIDHLTVARDELVPFLAGE